MVRPMPAFRPARLYLEEETRYASSQQPGYRHYLTPSRHLATLMLTHSIRGPDWMAMRITDVQEDSSAKSAAPTAGRAAVGEAESLAVRTRHEA
jgi:hypothetical protein